MQLTKELFVATLNALQAQHAKDMLYSAHINLMFDGDTGLYDNHTLKDALLKLLQAAFPPVDDHCAISHYCWELNFGKIGQEVELTAEDLWDELVKLHEADLVQPLLMKNNPKHGQE